MEYIPAITLLLATIIVFIAIFRKLTGEQLTKVFEGKNFLLVASLILFLVLSIVHLFQNQDWTADILKVIVGVFVGVSAAFVSDSSKKSTGDGDGVDISSSQLGDHAKIAGRDINETIENMQNDIAQIRDSVINQYTKIEETLGAAQPENEVIYDYILNTIYERFYQDDPYRITKVIQNVINRWQSEGWKFVNISSDYHGIDGMILFFVRPSRDGRSKVSYYHGSQMENI